MRKVYGSNEPVVGNTGSLRTIENKEPAVEKRGWT